MTTDETRELIEAYYDALPKGKHAIRPFLADDCEWYPPPGAPFEPVLDGDGIARMIGAEVVRTLFDRSMPFSIDVQATIVDGNTAVVRQRIEGTAANGNPYANDYCWIYECADGKIVKMIEYVDTLVAARAMGWI